MQNTLDSVARLNAGTVTCDSSSSSDQQCGVDSECSLVQGCTRWTCDTASQALVQVACSSLCQPRVLGLAAASLADDGKTVALALSARAAPLSLVPCGGIFDATSNTMLGGGAALCSTTSDDAVLTVRLAANATLVAGQLLALRTSGSALVGAVNTTRAFAGSIAVASCTSCVPPQARLTGPSSISRTACESAAGALLSAAASSQTATFDASQSVDPTGRARWAGVSWSVPAEYGSAAGRAALQAAVDRTNALPDVSDRLRLTLEDSEQASLEDDVQYRLQVTLTSWLNTSGTTTASVLVVSSNPAPVVAVTGPAVQQFRIISGLRLSGEVAGGGCKGRSLTWAWTAPGGWSGLPSDGQSGQSLTLRGPVATAVHGQSISLRVTAAYAGGGDSAAASADVRAVAVGSPPLAALAGPAGDVLDDTPLVLDATASSDPDSPTNAAALRYLWDCRREDYTTPCFTSSQQGDQSSVPGEWTLPAGLLASERWHTITVTVYKEVVSGATPLNATASVSFRPRSVATPFPRGSLARQCSSAACAAPHSTERDLSLLLQLAEPYDTTAAAASVTVTWASAEASAVGGLTALTASSLTDSDLPAGAFLLTIPAAVLPSARSSITITANLTAAASATAAAATGFAAITVPLNGAPYCTLSASETAACLALDVLVDTFPNAAVTLTARGWADAGDDASSQQQLRYEFGVRQTVVLTGGVTTAMNAVQQLGASTSATLVGMPEGVVQVYGCAIDVDGSRSCGRINVTVAAPAAGFDAAAALAAINMTDILQANDQRTLLQAAYQMSQLVAAAGSGGNATGFSQLVGDLSLALAQAMLSGGALEDAEQAPQAIAAMASLASSASSLPDDAKEAFMNAVKSAAQTLPGGVNATGVSDADGGGTAAINSFVTQLCRLMGAALPSASGSASRRAVLESAAAPTTTTTTTTAATTTATAWARLRDLIYVADLIGDALGRQAVPRGPYLATGDSGVFVSAAAIPTASRSAAKTVVQLSAGPEAVADADPAAAASTRLASSTISSVDGELVLAGGAATAATGYGIDLQYAPSAAAGLTAALAASLPSTVTLLGGLTTVTWNAGPDAAASPPSLDGSTNYLKLTIPAPGYNSLKLTTCLSYNVTTNAVAGSLTGVQSGGGAVTAVYDAVSGRLACDVSAVGTYVVAQSSVTTSPGATTEVDDENGKNKAAIIGGAVGGAVGLLLIIAVVAAVVLLRRRRRQAVTAAGGDGGAAAPAAEPSAPVQAQGWASPRPQSPVDTPRATASLSGGVEREGSALGGSRTAQRIRSNRVHSLTEGTANPNNSNGADNSSGDGTGSAAIDGGARDNGSRSGNGDNGIDAASTTSSQTRAQASLATRDSWQQG